MTTTSPPGPRVRFVARRGTVARLPRLFTGLILCGVGIALMIRADLGLAPWDVLHQGVSEHTGIPIGTVGILVGFVVLAAWIPLREPFGVGTVLNVITIGLTIDLMLAALPDDPGRPWQWLFLVGGIVLLGPGVGLYVGTGLGAGPRDGIMTALAARGYWLWAVRTAMEVTVLVAGWLLGGAVGLGTVLFALAIGPLAHFWLERLSLEPLELVHPTPVLEVE